jgi:hypothetical protein
MGVKARITKIGREKPDLTGHAVLPSLCHLTAKIGPSLRLLSCPLKRYSLSGLTCYRNRIVTHANNNAVRFLFHVWKGEPSCGIEQGTFPPHLSRHARKTRLFTEGLRVHMHLLIGFKPFCWLIFLHDLQFCNRDDKSKV